MNGLAKMVEKKKKLPAEGWIKDSDVRGSSGEGKRMPSSPPLTEKEKSHLQKFANKFVRDVRK